MVDYISDGKMIRCVFNERLDTVNCMNFEQELLEKVQEAENSIVFDLGKVDYIASSFLRICFRVSKTNGEGKLSLVNVSPEVKKVLKIAGVDKHIKVD